MEATTGGIRIRSLQVKAFSNATAVGLANDIEVWLQVNGKERRFVQIDYIPTTSAVAAFLTYTE